MSTGYTILISACFIVVLSMFGCLAGYKQVKCLLLTYVVFVFLFFVILIIGGVLAYIFREQAVNTIQAEMIADIRAYDPDNRDDIVTRAWVVLTACSRKMYASTPPIIRITKKRTRKQHTSEVSTSLACN